MCFDIGYIRWRADFAPFETNCFEQLREFVRLHFDDLIDRYYRDGQQALHEFPESGGRAAGIVSTPQIILLTRSSFARLTSSRYAGCLRMAISSNSL
jgi:hypothetical protein